MNDKYKYTFGLHGQSHFMRAAIEVLEPLENCLLNSGDWEQSTEYFNNIPSLFEESSPTALSGLEIIGGVMAFTATCFAKKVFDEFYERLLKRPVGAYIDGLLEKLNIPDTKLLEFRDVVYFEDLDVAIVIRILTRTPEAHSIDNKLLEMHCIAHQYLSKNGKKAPIHCHRVVEGKVNAQPEFFMSLKDLRNVDMARLKFTRNYGNTKANIL